MEFDQALIWGTITVKLLDNNILGEPAISWCFLLVDDYEVGAFNAFNWFFFATELDERCFLVAHCTHHYLSAGAYWWWNHHAEVKFVNWTSRAYYKRDIFFSPLWKVGRGARTFGWFNFERKAALESGCSNTVFLNLNCVADRVDSNVILFGPWHIIIESDSVVILW